MGQYHQVYNLDKKQTINARTLGQGPKLMEQCGEEKSTSTAVWLLLANSNGRDGGDALEHPLVGTWAGDRLVVQGDYANPNDQSYVADTDAYTDISNAVKTMLDAEYAV